MAHRLSKSRYQTGLQCPKALWLSCHARDLADPVDEATQHIFDTGTAVGELAQQRFPGGVLVAEDHTQPAKALETTSRLLDDPPPAIYEAAFRFRDVLVRADVIVNVGEGLWDLYEVKSTNSLKKQHVTDVAVQTWVLEGAGLRVRRSYLMHLDKTYEWPGGPHDLNRLFVAEDVTEATRTAMIEVPGRVEEMLLMLEGTEPGVPIGKHCDSPYTCAYWGHCHAHMPDRPVTSLPRISAGLLDSLVADGILSIDDIPIDYPGLTASQRDACATVRSGIVSTGAAADELASLTYPIHFLDFETFMAALPQVPGTRPWQQVPFQWSDHVLTEDGGLEHHEFLHEGSGDPRPGFIESLLGALGDEGSIVVYSSFENTQLNALATAFPEHAQGIQAVQARLFDLLKVVSRHVRHPECACSSSIKSVLPALVPELSYSDLAIGEGGTASLRYLLAHSGALPGPECEQVYADLREYCGLDTMAMVKLHEVLRA